MELIRKIEDSKEASKYLDTNLVLPEFKEFSEIIDCKICCGIVISPVCCKNCDNMFCKNCIYDWIRRSNGVCPNRCNFLEYEIRRMTINLMNKIKLYCINKEHGCKEEICYESYFKHLTNCDYSQYECIACGLKDNKKIISSHISNCPNMLVVCDFCYEKINRKELENHHQECQMYEINCRLCNQILKRYSYEKHLETECKEVEINCKYCNLAYKKKDENYHTKDVCFEEFKKNLVMQYQNNPNINKNNNNNSIIENLNQENIKLKIEIKEKDKIIENLNLRLNRINSNNNNKNNINNNGNKDCMGSRFVQKLSNISENVMNNIKKPDISNNDNRKTNDNKKNNCNKDNEQCNNQ